MKILTLDLGTKTGYAHNMKGAAEMGTWLLATSKEVREWGKNRMRRRGDGRVFRLALNLREYVRDRPPLSQPDLVVFEDVQFSSSTYQTQLWASLRAAVWLTCEQHSTIIECVPTGVLKRFATGHGGATKEMMLAAAERAEGAAKFDGLDDNAVDAYWVLKWAEQNLSRMKV